MHNFNLMAPDRSILLSEDVKPKMTITVDTGFLNSGNYAFYCFLHQYRGMEGMRMIDQVSLPWMPSLAVQPSLPFAKSALLNIGRWPNSG